MTSPEVAIIIVNYNGERWVRDCLGSLARTSYKHFRTWLVDNGSEDASLEIVTSEFPWVEVIRAGENLGFCEANNRGIDEALAAGADLIVLLNPDTWVEPDWLSELVAVITTDPGLGVAGAVQLRYEDQALNSWTTSAFPALRAELENPATAREVITVDWVEGACLMVSRQVLEEVGGLDTLYFAFYEEIDLCRRVRAHGYLVGLVPRSRIHHYRGGSWEATPARKLDRDRRCDRSQFIYQLTDPQRGRPANLWAGLRTLATKLKEAVITVQPRRMLDQLAIQLELLWRARMIHRKWVTDRRRLELAVGERRAAKRVSGAE